MKVVDAGVRANADVRRRLVFGLGPHDQHHTEGGVPARAVPDHVQVASLEDAQRQVPLRHQHQVQGEEWQVSVLNHSRALP